jgi:hypothetical protein
MEDENTVVPFKAKTVAGRGRLSYYGLPPETLKRLEGRKITIMIMDEEWQKLSTTGPTFLQRIVAKPLDKLLTFLGCTPPPSIVPPKSTIVSWPNTSIPQNETITSSSESTKEKRRKNWLRFWE